jgi:signal transduction histidine kinase/orotate phosphoribosyltransferase
MLRRASRILAQHPAAYVLDMSALTWADIFSLSMLTLWNRVLASAGIEVQLRPPRSIVVSEFLRSYNFFRLWQGPGSSLDIDGAQARATPLPDTVALPLTLFDKSSFRAIYSQLLDEDTYTTIFSELHHSDIVRSGLIRDVLLLELGDNIFDHAAASVALVAVVGTDAYPARDVPTAMPFFAMREKYLSRLEGQKIINIVVADNGHGIPHTIRDAYEHDSRVDGRHGDPEDLLEYAFHLNTSRRTVPQRMSGIQLEEAALNLPPATGLYRVREIVRDFHGFMLVRSGDVALAFDCYKSNVAATAIRANRYDGTKRLAPLGGTQYNIIIPARRPRRELFMPGADVSRQRSLVQESEYISIAEFIDTEEGPLASVDETQTVAFTRLRRLGQSSVTLTPTDEARTIDRVKMQLGEDSGMSPRRLTVVDFDACAGLGSKAIHYILYYCLLHSTLDRDIVAINLPSDVAIAAEQAFGETRIPATHAFRAFDRIWRSYDIGTLPSDRRVVAMAITGLRLTDVDAEVATRCKGLLHFDTRENRYLQKYTRESTADTARHAIESRLASVLSDPNEGIYTPDVCVELPSGSFVKGYFDVAKLVAQPNQRRMLEVWMSLILARTRTRPQAVISSGRACRVIMPGALRRYEELIDGRVRWEHADDSSAEFFQHAIGEIALKRLPTVLFLDVVSTGGTIRRLSTSLGDPTVLRSCAIVDTRDRTSALSSGVTAVLRHPLAFSERLFDGVAEAQIYAMDPDTHAISALRRSESAGSWKSLRRSRRDNQHEEHEFLEDLVAPAQALINGHFVESNHLTTFFLTRAMARRSGDAMAMAIAAATPEISGASPMVVCYPAFSPGVELLAARIAAVNRNRRTIRLTKRLLDSGKAPLGVENEAVLILDDAVSSGDHLLSMLDAVSRGRPESISVVALLMRGSSKVAARLASIGKYRDTSVIVRFLSTLESPTFTADQCPRCKRLAQLRRLLDEVTEPGLRGRLAQRISMLRPIAIESVAQAPDSYRSQPFDEDLAEARAAVRVAAAASYSGERRMLIEEVNAAAVGDSALRALYVAIDDDSSRAAVVGRDGILTHQNVNLALKRRLERDVTGDATRRSDRLLAAQLLSNIDSAAAVRAVADVAPRLGADELVDILVTLLTSEDVGPGGAILGPILVDAGAGTRERASILEVRRLLENSARASVTLGVSSWERFKRLEGAAFHEVNHKLDNIKADIGLGEIERVSRDWDEFAHEVTSRIVLDAEEFVLSRPSEPAAAALVASLTQVRAFVARTSREMEAARTDHEVGLRIAENAILKAENVLYGPDGLKTCSDAYKCDLNAMMSSVGTEFRSKFDRRNISLRSHPHDQPGLAFATDDIVRTTLRNLLENVLKHAAHATAVSIDINVPERNLIELQVKDDGSGEGEWTYGVGLMRTREAVESVGGDIHFTPGAKQVAIKFMRIPPIEENL